MIRKSRQMKSIWRSLVAKSEHQTAHAKLAGRRYRSSKIALSLNDVHFPHHDAKRVKEAVAFAKYLQPDVIILNGDIVDFYDCSTFAKDPNRALSMQSEINQAVKFISDLREAVPNAEMYYNLGNHELRLERYLSSSAPALASLDCLALDKLLKLDEHGVEMRGAGGFMLNQNTLVKHGSRVSKHSGWTAKAEWESNLMNGISAHTHRAGRFDVCGAGGRFYWVEGGCLCELDPSKIGYVDSVPNWQHALTIVEFTSSQSAATIVDATGGVVYPGF